MKNLLENLDNKILNDLDMSLSKHINNEEYKRYYVEVSSKEHYRLLTYISNLFNDIKILDVGTLKGCSALALSTNKNNKVFSFNISNQLELIDSPDNIEFIVDNVINGKYDNIIIQSKIILLDTFHDATFELEFLDYLEKLKYKGVLILDDIFLNDNMMNFWKKIKLDKLDITQFGHSTGTGLVFLN